MKKLIAVIGILAVAPVFAFGGAGTSRSGELATEAQNVSRPVKMIIQRCGTGRTRQLVNYEKKCATREARKGIARRKSNIGQRNQPRFRGSNQTYTPVKVTVTESLRDKVKRILAARRAAKK